MAKRSTTMNRGADDERAAIIAYIKRQIKKLTIDQHPDNLQDVLEWIKKRAKRTQAKVGGLGRKKS